MGNGLVSLDAVLPTPIGNFKNSKFIYSGRYGATCAENNGAIFCWTSLNSTNQEKLFSNIGLSNSTFPVKMNINLD